MRTYEVMVEVRYTERVTVEMTEHDALDTEKVLKQARYAAGLPEKGASLYYMRDVTPPPKSVKERVRDAFKALRKEGFVARMNYSCCGSCGWAQVEQDYSFLTGVAEPNVVFYHRQDADCFDKKGNLVTYKHWNVENELVNKTASLYLAWSGDGAMIVDALETEGLEVDWNGNDNRRIAVTGVKGGIVNG